MSTSPVLWGLLSRVENSPCTQTARGAERRKGSCQVGVLPASPRLICQCPAAPPLGLAEWPALPLVDTSFLCELSLTKLFLGPEQAERIPPSLDEGSAGVPAGLRLTAAWLFTRFGNRLGSDCFRVAGLFCFLWLPSSPHRVRKKKKRKKIETTLGNCWLLVPT